MKQTSATRRARALTVFLFVAVNLLFPLTTLAAPARQGQIHTVQPGETLSSIAARYGVSLSAIMQANGISNANVIYVGQRLTIPAGSSGTVQTHAATTTSGSSSGYGSDSAEICDKYTVRFRDSLSMIAGRYNVTVESIRQANGPLGSFIWPGLTLNIPCSATYLHSPERNPVYQPTPYEDDCPSTADRYQVRSGDTLARIARRCGVSPQAIREMNGLRSDTIYVGQWLIIRGPGRATATPTSYYVPTPTPTFTPTPAWAGVTPTATPTAALSGWEVFPTPQGR
ncbi:MAG: LysM peptidoglycan-binding domain-containing protein [Anaerolineae bacterium]|nr:LysM peptidoglycan-binding domain-containing protein [Anaerolineae bacterium]